MSRDLYIVPELGIEHFFLVTKISRSVFKFLNPITDSPIVLSSKWFDNRFLTAVKITSQIVVVLHFESLKVKIF